jgi:hypothetical protein
MDDIPDADAPGKPVAVDAPNEARVIMHIVLADMLASMSVDQALEALDVRNLSPDELRIRLAGLERLQAEFQAAKQAVEEEKARRQQLRLSREGSTNV